MSDDPVRAILSGRLADLICRIGGCNLRFGDHTATQTFACEQAALRLLRGNDQHVWREEDLPDE